MDIHSAENSIFYQWQSRYDKSIIPDGIIHEPSYKAAKIKILFLLKEVNDEDGGKWDLRNFLYNGGRAATWTPVAIWLKGISSLPNKLSFEEAHKTPQPQRTELLRSIACMNLKKYGGGAKTKKKELQSIARANEDLLNRQFELYSEYSDLDYVICGGPDIKHLAKELIVPIRNAESWQRMTETNVEYLEFATHKYAIAFWHPQQHSYKGKEVYNWIVDTIAILETRKKKPCNTR
jgi:hypothetical protein